ncbi:response regulator transcription factor [Mycobacterium sp. 852013-50091_SCH5140682]|uniref:LuxR C-terminal-related transcriptional regulator n=1 Tax=Mycobacterium sp. 852013-50091_SCH5140682 TaxID=1834109 RepID=UPI0018D2BC74|nr:response regulator transcription factor [Mycobacterium sp. 852013-50091_SCH5140682]
MHVVIVSDIRLYREGLARVLALLPDIESVVTCESAAECVGLIDRVESDIILLDMSALGSASSARLFCRECPSVKVVALAVPETEHHVLACVEAGVMGYVAREGSIDDLVCAIRHAARGEALCSPSITGGLMRRVAMLAHDNSVTNRLTPRELEIAEHIALGTTNRGIASSLGIELCTVKNHVHNILDKLGIERRADVAACIGR